MLVRLGLLDVSPINRRQAIDSSGREVEHPFSLSPAATWIQQGEQGWWAPCIWCGFGIAATRITAIETGANGPLPRQ